MAARAKLVVQAPADLQGRVLRLLLDGLSTGQMSEAEVARRLGLSERSLRRQLQASGTSYKAILTKPESPSPV